MEKRLAPMRWTPEELNYLKALYKLKTEHSLRQLALLASRNLNRTLVATEGKLKKIAANGEIWE